MNKKTVDTLLKIAGVGLAIAGIVFLLAAIFDDDKNNWILVLALSCSLLSNLFHLEYKVIRRNNNKIKKVFKTF